MGDELDDYLNEIVVAEQHGLWMLALTGALALPDICGAIESANGRATGNKYRGWFTRHISPKYPRIDPEDCWQLRCSLLHQGRSSAVSYQRLIFVAPGPITFHNNILDDALNLDMRTFCTDVISAVRSWQGQMQSTANPSYQGNIGQVMRWHRGGLSPYVVGVDVLS